MDREYAIEELKKFKNYSGVSRDKCIEIYNSFKMSPTAFKIAIPYHGELINVERSEFWDYIKTSDIREVYSTGYTQSLDGECNNEPEDEETLLKLRKQKLAIQDKLNFERKINNKSLRNLNTLEELNKEIIDKLGELEPIKFGESKDIINFSNDDVMVLSIGDWHLGEISYEFKDTGFDMEIASKRIKKYADYIKKEVIHKGIKKVVIMCGGDICNNVTLLSKRLLQTSNRAVTTIMAVVLLQHLILDIYSVCKNIVFAGVGNNESRYDEDYFEDEYLITNCADFVVYNMLELLFKNIDTIKFLNGRNCEKVVNINGQNILLTHGVTFGKGDVEKAVQQAISRYSVKGVDIRYVLMSHIHCTRNSNYFSRHGSLCSGNAYSNSTLNLQTRASQNILYVSKNGDIQSVLVDLENIDDVVGYDIKKEIEKFDLKTRSKNKDLDEVQIA